MGELKKAVEYFVNDIAYKAPEQLPDALAFHVERFRRAIDADEAAASPAMPPHELIARALLHAAGVTAHRDDMEDPALLDELDRLAKERGR